MSYGNEVEKPGLRPYAFVKFGKIMFAIDPIDLLTRDVIRHIHAKDQKDLSRHSNTKQLVQA